MFVIAEDLALLKQESRTRHVSMQILFGMMLDMLADEYTRKGNLPLAPTAGLPDGIPLPDDWKRVWGPFLPRHIATYKKMAKQTGLLMMDLCFLAVRCGCARIHEGTFPFPQN
jgi:hypothetical protein